MRFKAVAIDERGAPALGLREVWSSSDPAIAKVDQTGLVTAESVGSTVLEASVGGVSGTASVSVAPEGRQVFFMETFDDSDVRLRGWFDNTAFTLTALEKLSGAQSLEIHFPAGAVTPTFGSAARILFPETESVYLRYWVKYSANWVGSGQPYHPHEFYFLTNVDGIWIGPAATHLTAYVEHNYSGGLRPVVGVQDALNIVQDRIGVDLTQVTEARAIAGCNGSSDGYPTDCYDAGGGSYRNFKMWSGNPYLIDSPGSRYKNDWHLIEAYFQLNSISGGRGQKDGVVRYWTDGQQLINATDVVFRTAVHPDMKFRELLLGPYIGPGSPVDQTMWIDDLSVGAKRD